MSRVLRLLSLVVRRPYMMEGYSLPLLTSENLVSFSRIPSPRPVPRCCTHLIQPTILGCFHLKVRDSYRKTFIMTERPPSLCAVPDRGEIESHSWYIVFWWYSLLYRLYRIGQKRYGRFAEISQLALLYLLSREPGWNVPLKIWAYKKAPSIIPEIFRLPSDGTVTLFHGLRRAKVN